jgi:hypothetical protein
MCGWQIIGGTMTEQATEIVRGIVRDNTYLTLSTANGDQPWGAAVQYVADEDLNLYFVSLPDSRHMSHIMANPSVAVTIFDSRQPPFTSRGVQIEGTADAYSTTDNPFARIGGFDWPENLQELVPGYVAVRVTPARFYLPRFIVDGVQRDERVEVIF